MVKQLRTAIQCERWPEAYQLLDAVEQLECKLWPEADQVLDAVEQRTRDQSQVRQVRAAVCFHHAQALSEQGHLRDALTRAREALQLEPEHRVIKDVVAQLAEWAPEEANLRHMQTARASLEAERFDQAITSAGRVPARSKLHEQARRLQSGAYFQRSIAAYKDQNLERAEADLGQALAFNDNPKEQELIRKQLQILRQANVNAQLKSALDREDWPRAATVLRAMLDDDQLSRSERQMVQKQLAQVLNAQAFALVNQAQALEKDFGEALQDIVSRVRQRQGGYSVSHVRWPFWHTDGYASVFQGSPDPSH